MTSSIDSQTVDLSKLLDGIELDNNVFNESPSAQVRSIGRQSVARPPLQASLSLPLEPFHHADLSGAGDTVFLPTRLPAPKLVERRQSHSFAEPHTLNQGVGRDVQGTAKQASTAAPARYKTELCRPYEENGTCRYGSKCQFAHGMAELRSVVRHPKYKTDLCKTFHTTGLCPYGPRCHFIHNDDERRSSESSDQMRQQLAAAAVQQIGRRSTSVQHGLEDRPRLQRQYSEYQPRAEPRQRGVPVPGGARGGLGVEVQRRASAVADLVIRNANGYQRQLQTVLEADRFSGLDVVTAARSLGSVADSSSASSMTDSPSPSPTAGLILPVVENSVTPTAAVRQAPAVPAGWSAENDHTRAALQLAELIARLGLGRQEVAALIRALQVHGNGTGSGGLLPPGIDRIGVDATVPQWSSDTWTQYHHLIERHCQQRQQPHGPATSNVC